MADPIFALIERFDGLNDLLADLGKREPSLPADTAEYEEWNRANNEAIEAADAALEKMVSSRPATVAGAAALVRCYLDRCNPEYAGPEAELLLKTLSEFLPARAR
jgi:hypothetical protein